MGKLAIILGIIVFIGGFFLGICLPAGTYSAGVICGLCAVIVLLLIFIFQKVYNIYPDEKDSDKK